jgi:hypothetical protein
VSLRRDITALPSEMQAAGAAAGALALSLLLPWYEKSYFPKGSKEVKANLSAFGVFTFVEAAVLLVAAAVVFLVWARSQRKRFHLPGGDGAAITLGGGWAALLLVWRVFDKPAAKGSGATIGLQWGIVIAFFAAAAVVAAGLRVRARHRPEPPNPVAEEPDDWIAPPRRPREPRPDRRPRDPTTVTEAFRERPEWRGDPAEPPGRAPRPEDPETRRFRDDDPATRRLRDDPADAETRRLPGGDQSEDATRRLGEDGPPGRRRRRRPEDDARAETQRLWEDDDPPAGPAR